MYATETTGFTAFDEPTPDAYWQQTPAERQAEMQEQADLAEASFEDWRNREMAKTRELVNRANWLTFESQQGEA